MTNNVADISDRKLAHVFLVIDSSDDGLTITQLIDSLMYSRSCIQLALAELREMKCIRSEYEIIDGQRYTVNVSTGHNCWYCRPTLATI